uniref:DNA replication complex GINS protein PSF1 n=1 Tax=Acrobeloides nanus TaxID=290746 RepID=A0A914C4M0_9BILA
MTSTTKSNVANDAMSLINDLILYQDSIPPYKDEVVKKCAKQIEELYQANYDDILAMRSKLDSSSSSASSIHDDPKMQLCRARQNCIEHIKRLCLTYLTVRLDRLKSLRWKHGGLLPFKIKNNLSPSETEWLNGYSRMLAEFQQSIGDNGVNLFGHIHPPKSLHIHVRALSDYGEFELSDGTTIILKKNSLHYIPREDCDTLLKQGILEFANLGC